MATLEISFNCLCLFVPEPGTKTVHVLMPVTQRHHQHVVRAIHGKFGNGGRSMEHWVLQLGEANGSPDLSLQPRCPPSHYDEIVNLTPLADRRLDRRVIDDTTKVVARVELHIGQVKELRADASWEISGRRIAMADRVVWETGNVSDEHLTWRHLGGTGGGNPPFTLRELDGGSGAIKIDVFHVLPRALPPNDSGALSQAEIRAHFQEFYRLYGITNPTEGQLPRNPRKITGFADLVTDAARVARESGDPGAIDLLADLARVVAQAADENRSVEVAELMEAFFIIDRYNCPTARGSFQ